MKKKTAITLALLALLAAGVTFGNIKIKEKKEKDKIEKELKEIMIPNAEAELEELLKKDSDLKDSISKFNDSIVYYNDFIEQQKKGDFANDNKYVSSCVELIRLLDSIRSDLVKETNKLEKKFEKAGALKYSNILLASKEDRNYLAYLSHGMMKNLYEVDSFSIPGTIMVPRHDDVKILSIYLDEGLGDYIDCDKYPMFTGLGNYEYRISVFTGKRELDENGFGLTTHVMLSKLKRALKATIMDVDGFTLDGAPALLPQYDNPHDIFKVVQAVYIFLDNIDNSKKVINSETLAKAQRLSKQLLTYVNNHEIMIRNNKIDNAKEKIQNFEEAKTDFKNAEKRAEQLVRAKERVLKNYKKPNAGYTIYNQRKSMKK